MDQLKFKALVIFNHDFQLGSSQIAKYVKDINHKNKTRGVLGVNNIPNLFKICTDQKMCSWEMLPNMLESYDQNVQVYIDYCYNSKLNNYTKFYADLEWDDPNSIKTLDSIIDMIMRTYSMSTRPKFTLAGYGTKSAIDKFIPNCKYTNGVLGKESVYSNDNDSIVYLETHPDNEIDHKLSCHVIFYNVFVAIDSFTTHVMNVSNNFEGYTDPSVYTTNRKFRLPCSVKPTSKQYPNQDDPILVNKAVNFNNIKDFDFTTVVKYWCIGSISTKLSVPELEKLGIIIIGDKSTTTNLNNPDLKIIDCHYDQTKSNGNGTATEHSKYTWNDREIQNMVDLLRRGKSNRSYLYVDPDTFTICDVPDGVCNNPDINNAIMLLPFKANGCFGFISELFELSYGAKHHKFINFPYEILQSECYKWYEHRCKEHTRFEEFDDFWEEITHIFDICDPEVEDYDHSAVAHLKNLWYKVVYPDEHTEFEGIKSNWFELHSKLRSSKYVNVSKKTAEKMKTIVTMFMTSYPNYCKSFKYNNETFDQLKLEVYQIQAKYIDDIVRRSIKAYGEQLSSDNDSKEKFLKSIYAILDNIANVMRQAKFYQDCYMYNKINNTTPMFYQLVDLKYYKMTTYNGEIQYSDSSETEALSILKNKRIVENLPKFGSHDEFKLDIKSILMKQYEEEFKQSNEFKELTKMYQTNGYSINSLFEEMYDRWMNVYRQTFENDDDCDFCLSWYSYKLRNVVIDRNMLNYGRSDCLKSSLFQMISHYGYDFSIMLGDTINKDFDAPFYDHSAVLIDEIERMSQKEIDILVNRIKALYGTKKIDVADKNVKRHTVNRRVDYDMATNDTNDVLSKFTKHEGSSDALTKRICIISRKSLPKELIYDHNKFPDFKNGNIYLLYRFIKKLAEEYNAKPLEWMHSYKSETRDSEILSGIIRGNSDLISAEIYNDSMTEYGRSELIETVLKIAKLTRRKSNDETIARDKFNSRSFDMSRTGLDKLAKYCNEKFDIVPFEPIKNLFEFLNNYKTKIGIEFQFNKKSGLCRITGENLDKLIQEFSEISYSDLYFFNEEGQTMSPTDRVTAFNKLMENYNHADEESAQDNSNSTQVKQEPVQVKQEQFQQQPVKQEIVFTDEYESYESEEETQLIECNNDSDSESDGNFDSSEEY